MINLFFVFSNLVLIPRILATKVGCDSQATVLSQFDREGFHIDVHYLIELIVDVETAHKWEKCVLLLKENITSSFYVNPDQLTELNRAGISQACTPHKVNVEASEHLSKGHIVYVYGQLQRSQNLIYSQLYFPIHVRYHKPKLNGGYSTAEIKSPVLLIRCPDFDCKNLVKSKAPCLACGNELCTWNRFPFKINNKNLTLPIPVGNLNHLWFVSPVTYLLTFGGCLYIIITVIIKGGEDNFNQHPNN